jgi:hypothetical protein
MVFFLVHGFRLGLYQCLSFRFKFFLCSFGYVYTVILKRRGVLCTNGQGGVVAGKSVSHHHHRCSAWQSTESGEEYGDTGVMETGWATAGERRYRDDGDALGKGGCSVVHGLGR